MHVKEAIEGYLLFKAVRASPRTIETDTVLLRQFAQWIGDAHVHRITPQDVVGYLGHLRARELSAHTVKRHYAVLSAMWTWLTSPQISLAETHVVRVVPVPKLPQRKVAALSGRDLKLLLGAAGTSRNPQRDTALLLFLLDTACRATEVTSLQVAGVDFREGRCRVTGKGDKERTVYLNPRALQALWLYVKQERPSPTLPGCDAVFLTQDGRSLDRHALRRIIKRLGRRAGVDCHPHQFRHTSAIEHLRGGMDSICLQGLLGHETLEMTRQYLRELQDDDIEEQARRSSPVERILE